MHVQTQEDHNHQGTGKYKVFHQVHITTDREGNQPATHVKSVAYHTPNQGFRDDVRTRHSAPFEIRYGPCWGRPHLTVDVELESEVLRAVFEDNLPSNTRTFLIYQPPVLEPDDSPEDAARTIQRVARARQVRLVQPRSRVPSESNHNHTNRSRPQRGLTDPANPPALGHSLEPSQVPDHLVCSVSCEVFRDPVICMDGHTYERSAIETWFRDHDTSPMTNMKLPNKTIVPNLALRQELDRLAQDM